VLADAVDDAADRPRQDDRPAPSVDRGVGVWIARRAVITQLASFGPHPEVGRGVGVGLDQTLAVHAQLVVDVEGARRGASNAQCVSWSNWFLPTAAGSRRLWRRDGLLVYRSCGAAWQERQKGVGPLSTMMQLT
jgi:hypothetical protein